MAANQSHRSGDALRAVQLADGLANSTLETLQSGRAADLASLYADTLSVTPPIVDATRVMVCSDAVTLCGAFAPNTSVAIVHVARRVVLMGLWYLADADLAEEGPVQVALGEVLDGLAFDADPLPDRQEAIRECLSSGFAGLDLGRAKAALWVEYAATRRSSLEELPVPYPMPQVRHDFWAMLRSIPDESPLSLRNHEESVRRWEDRRHPGWSDLVSFASKFRKRAGKMASRAEGDGTTGKPKSREIVMAWADKIGLPALQQRAGRDSDEWAIETAIKALDEADKIRRQKKRRREQQKSTERVRTAEESVSS